MKRLVFLVLDGAANMKKAAKLLGLHPNDDDDDDSNKCNYDRHQTCFNHTLALDLSRLFYSKLTKKSFDDIRIDRFNTEEEDSINLANAGNSNSSSSTRIATPEERH